MAQRTCPSCNTTSPLDGDNRCVQCGAYIQPPPESILGANLGNLQIIRLIGEGAMGTVYLARHLVLQTPYAVKILSAEFSQDRMAAERFRQEAMVGSTLRHPNIAFVTDFGFNPSMGLYLVMEYLPGKPLTDLIDDEDQLTLWRVIQISKQLCDALEAAHILGAIHRDLKPDNIFILNQGGQRDKVKVLDWGLARLVYDRSRRLVQEGVALGTPVYMSPEQISGEDEDIGPASDIYALGLVIFEMLVGQPPFDDDDSQTVMGMHLDDEPERLSEHRPELEDTILDDLIDQMLAKEPEDRPRSMREVKEQLVQAFRQLQGMGLPGMVPETISGTLNEAARTAQRMANPNDLFTEDEAEGEDEATLLERLFLEQPGLPDLPPTLFFTTGWGLLQYDLLHTELDSDRFLRAASQTASLIESYIDSASGSTSKQEETREVLYNVLGDLFQLADQERQLRVIKPLRSLIPHHIFPRGALPSWARPQVGGTWSTVKQALTTDIRDLFQPTRSSRVRALQRPQPTEASGDEDDEPEPDPIALPEVGHPPEDSGGLRSLRDALNQEIHIFPKSSDYDQATQERASLAEKLNRDVTIETIRDVLGHQIKIFPRNKRGEAEAGDDEP